MSTKKFDEAICEVSEFMHLYPNILQNLSMKQKLFKIQFYSLFWKLEEFFCSLSIEQHFYLGPFVGAC